MSRCFTNRLLKSWKLPAPPKDGRSWKPVVRIGRTIPFGYYQDPEDPDILLPIKEELDELELAKKLVKEYSYEDIAYWLSKETGRKISAYGLRKRIKLEQKRRTKATNARLYEKKAKEAAEKARKLEEGIGGCKAYTD